jgi:hypothetical protein
MKLVYGYESNGNLLITTVDDDSLSDNPDDIKQLIDSVSSEGEGYVELSRKACQVVSKHMQFGKNGQMRVLDAG